MAVQPVPEALLPEAGAGRAIPAAPEKLQESLKGPANTALQSRKPWETKSPSDRNPMKRDAPTNSCSEPFFHLLMCACTFSFQRLHIVDSDAFHLLAFSLE